MHRSLLVLPALAIVAVALVLPLGVLAVYSFWSVRVFRIVPEWNLDNYREAIEVYGTLILHTIATAAAVAAIVTFLATPIAYACRFKLGRWRDAVVFMLFLALFSGYLVRIYAWKTILGEKGLLNIALEWLGVIDQPLQVLLYSRFALVVTLIGFLLPLAVLPMYAALQNLPRERIDASHDLGAGRVETAIRIVIPEIAGAMVVAFSLCFVLVAGDWVTPTLVGGPRSIMVGQAIQTQFGAIFNWPLGGALAFTTALAMAVVIAIAAGAAWILRAAPWERAA